MEHNILEEAIKNNDTDYIKKSIDYGTSVNIVLELVMKNDKINIIDVLYEEKYINLCDIFKHDLFRIAINNNSINILNNLKDKKENLEDECYGNERTILDETYTIYLKDAINQNNNKILDVLFDMFYMEDSICELSEEIVELIEYALDNNKSKIAKHIYDYLMEVCEDENPFQMWDLSLVKDLYQRLGLSADDALKLFKEHEGDYNEYSDDE